jgi:ABC-type methionine transport system ATPase subunit
MAQVDVNLTAKGKQVEEPWIWRLARDFNVKVIITRANVDEDFGWIQVRLDGPVEEIQRATAWLMTTGLHVDALQRSVKT